MLKRFTKGAPPAGLKMLNLMVDEINVLRNLRGDDQFLYILPGEGGAVGYIDIEAIKRCIPHTPFFPSAFFGVLVKANGTSGGRPAYDLYDFDDTGYTNPMNVAGAVAPNRPGPVVADGSVGNAYYDATGAIQLFDCFDAGSSNAAFHVWLTQNGGSAGTDGTAGTAAFCSFTYNVFANSSKTIQIGTAVTVQAHRLLQVAMTAATEGLAQYESGTLVLLEAWEYAGRDSC